MQSKFIMILFEGFGQYIYEDLRHDDRVIVLNQMTADISNPILRFARNVHLSKRIASKISLPFKSIWGASLDSIPWDDDTEYFVILLEPYPLKPTYFNNLRTKHNVKLVFYAGCVWGDNAYYSEMQREYAKRIKYDYFFTFDEQDAIKYNYIYYPWPYSVISSTKMEEIENDLYLIGKANGRALNRLSMFHNVYKYLSENGVSMDFRITGVPRRDQLSHERIIYNKPLPYSEVIEKVKRSNCILEVLATGQFGATQRYYEAVCYNKKLLTDNKNVVNLPFYNPEYMHVFEKPEDIDWKWVKERIPVDYHYDGRFSPTHFIDKIIELEEQKEAQGGGKEK